MVVDTVVSISTGSLSNCRQSPLLTSMSLSGTYHLASETLLTKIRCRFFTKSSRLRKLLQIVPAILLVKWTFIRMIIMICRIGHRCNQLPDTIRLLMCRLSKWVSSHLLKPRAERKERGIISLVPPLVWCPALLLYLRCPNWILQLRHQGPLNSTKAQI